MGHVNLWVAEAAASTMTYGWLGSGKRGSLGRRRVRQVLLSVTDLKSIWEWKKWHRCRHQEITQFSTDSTIQQLVSQTGTCWGLPGGRGCCYKSHWEASCVIRQEAVTALSNYLPEKEWKCQRSQGTSSFAPGPCLLQTLVTPRANTTPIPRSK